MPYSLGIIGCGQIAYAIIKGLTQNRSIDLQDIIINDISQERIGLFEKEFNAKFQPVPDLIKDSDIVLLAVKPQQVKEVLENSEPYWNQNKLLISVAAGITIKFLEEKTGPVPVVRTMPNTPCLAGMGVVAISGGSFAQEKHIDLAEQIFINIAKCIIIEENYLNAITAISGSGPAYLYLTVEALVNAAVSIGLNHQLANFLVIETLKGSIELLEKTGEHPAVLRDKVSSPGGTTIAAISQLESRGIRSAYFEAVQKAWQRAKELGE
ncbi:MAG TPA: pyrroline-5-carboxylate reductase [Syntrophomonadaceae bacterium]|nr:pyrroline-5-carboxylate reductase [Syntrophomonadaceae bacterium]HNX29159.1 pyrroline-5-carboxylate reductase [Syntrophomonadaceae bacterium]HPR93668.1 pyrroline-5-carboxylate reductase [Syntrophomonadaceae bacterium]